MAPVKPRSHKTERQQQQRRLREQRELAKELQERAQQEAEPRRDDGPLPRID
jgi:hypothetical protein